MSEQPPLTKAVFTPQSGSDRTAVEVHFNPVSLQHTVNNTLKNAGKGKKKKQHIEQSTAKLTMDLIFDTTDNGQNVRQSTGRIAKFLDPIGKDTPPVVLFEWGAFRFQGLFESFKETIDFFSPNGVPLRASVNVSMVEQEKVFDTPGTQADVNSDLAPDEVVVPAPPNSPFGAAHTAAQAGNADAARQIAADNDQESLRFASGGALTVSASVSFKPPSAFATGGAGLSAGAGLSVGASAGIGIGGAAGISLGAAVGGGVSAGSGVGVGLKAGAGLSLSGGGQTASMKVGLSSLSKGVPATQGAFAGLRVQTSVGSGGKIDPARLLPKIESGRAATDANATFRVGGAAILEESSSFSADVGAKADLRASLKFDEG
jgi:Contractile injection system tube protein